LPGKCVLRGHDGDIGSKEIADCAQLLSQRVRLIAAAVERFEIFGFSKTKPGDRREWVKWKADRMRALTALLSPLAANVPVCRKCKGSACAQGCLCVKLAHGSGMMGGGMMREGMMGRGMMMMSPVAMRIIFALMDADGDGTVSLQEFQTAHERIFEAMDANKDGVLTLEEIQSFMRGTSAPAQQPFTPPTPPRP
jgi:hypothetical protein